MSPPECIKSYLANFWSINLDAAFVEIRTYEKCGCQGVFWRFCDSHEQKNILTAAFFVSPGDLKPTAITEQKLSNINFSC